MYRIRNSNLKEEIMQVSRLIVVIFLVGLLSSGCTTTSGSKTGAATSDAMEATPAATKANYEAAMAAAKEAQKKADSVGGEWRDVAKFLSQAELAAESGDYAKAIKLANMAKFQCEAGYKQAISQMDAGPRF